MPGLAIAILKLGAWVILLLGVGLALAISFLAPPAVSGVAGPWYAFPDYVRIALEFGCAFAGFMIWALMLVVATLAEQLEQLQASLSKSES